MGFANLGTHGHRWSSFVTRISGPMMCCEQCGLSWAFRSLFAMVGIHGQFVHAFLFQSWNQICKLPETLWSNNKSAKFMFRSSVPAITAAERPSTWRSSGENVTGQSWGPTSPGHSNHHAWDILAVSGRPDSWDHPPFWRPKKLAPRRENWSPNQTQSFSTWWTSAGPTGIVSKKKSSEAREYYLMVCKFQVVIHCLPSLSTFACKVLGKGLVMSIKVVTLFKPSSSLWINCNSLPNKKHGDFGTGFRFDHQAYAQTYLPMSNAAISLIILNNFECI